MIVYLATNNPHKAEELAPLLPGVELRLPRDAGIEFDPEEDGADFLANSLIKARVLHALVRAPVLADDSGLCVDALGGEPGIRSARYGQVEGGPKLEAADRNRLLLEAVRGAADRACRFVCCLTLVRSDDRFFAVQETCEGVLLEAPRGSGGFGYDPIVYLPELGRSVAELTMEEKSRVSHRGRAARRMAALLVDLIAAP
ncbi:MAG TPA: RdgB/HAM1 family non-canonical purine NTP pyrophosphatase [Spirochaetales bacterium]|nr:RdgB/HAM1 family non-canonical purine NTP pyrophosphatase [Spirochaetales bacterium]